MPDPVTTSPLLAVARDLVAWLQAEQVPGAIIGGVAASLLGSPRVTKDVDALLVLEENSWARFVEAGRSYGFLPRVADPAEFARESRVLLMQHVATGIEVDLTLAGLPFEEEAVAQAADLVIGSVRFPVVTPEDLIVMKVFAGRSRDLVDVAAVLDAQPHLDLPSVRERLAGFAELLDAPELLDRLDQLVAGRA